MDYDDNDFQSQNLHLAGEGSNKFPPVLNPYALPKFEFDDNIHVPLRYDSLVETEVFLGIENNEDSQWIEDYSRGSNTIQFASSAAESCCISRQNNVWSEATSSESVEMLLRSVGNEENVPVHNSAKKSDACDELGCMINQMEPSSKQDSNLSNRAVDFVDVQQALPSADVAEGFPTLHGEAGGQEPLDQDVSAGHDGDNCFRNGLGDLTAVGAGGELSVAVESHFIDSNCDIVGQSAGNTVIYESLAIRTVESYASEVQVDIVDAENVSVGNIRTENEDVVNQIVDTSDDVKHTDEMDVGDCKEERIALNKIPETRVSQEISDATMVEAGSEELHSPVRSVPVENVSEVNLSGSNLSNMERPFTLGTETDLSENLEATDVSRGSESLLLPHVDDRGHEGSSNVSQLQTDSIENLEATDVSRGSESILLPHVDDRGHDGSSNVCQLQTDSIENIDATDVSRGSESILLPHVDDGGHDGSSNVSQLQTDSIATSSGVLPISEEDNGPSADGTERSEVTHAHSSSDYNLLDAKACEGTPSSFAAETLQGHERETVPQEDENSRLSLDGLVQQNNCSVSPSSSGTMHNEVQISLTTDRSIGSLPSLDIEDKVMGTEPAVDAAAGNTTVGTVDPSIVEASSEALRSAQTLEEDDRDVPISGTSEGTPTVDPVLELEKGASGASGQILSANVDESLSMVDECSRKDQIDSEAVTVNVDPPESSNGIEHSVPPTSTEKKDNAAIIKVTDVEASSMKAQDNVSSLDVSQKGLVEDEAVQSTGTNDEQDVLTNRNGNNVSATECGTTAADPEKQCIASSVVPITELSEVHQTEEINRYSHLSTSASVDADNSCSQDSKRDPPSKDDGSFTFQVTPFTESPQVENTKKSKLMETIEPSKVSMAMDVSPMPGLGQLTDIPQVLNTNELQLVQTVEPSKGSAAVNVSPSTSGLGQLDGKVVQDISHQSPKVSDVPIPQVGTKGNSERKPRRRATGKESAKKVKTPKEITPAKMERGNKAIITPSSSVVAERVQSNEMQRFGHMDNSGMKPLTSMSGLPDLNSSTSAMVFQPFTDMQQVQLRAQIFAYGALIQGTAPEEAYMISAFGGPDGGKSAWEKPWRVFVERLNSQRTHLNTPETPVQSHSARVPDQISKQSTRKGKVISSSGGRSSSKATPTITSPIPPISTPLWNVSTPSDHMQSIGMARSPVLDFQRTLSPLPSQQSPAMRNLVAHSPWMSQGHFGHWMTSSQTSAVDSGGHFTVHMPHTEPVHLTPVKESSAPLSSAMKHVSAPLVTYTDPLGNLLGNTSMPETGKVVISSGQQSAIPKPRKRKKSVVPENSVDRNLLPQSLKEFIPSAVVTSHMSTSVVAASHLPTSAAAITTPVHFVPKAPAEILSASASPSPLTTTFVKGNLFADQRDNSSDEALGKVKEARVHAEGAAALAATAVIQSQEIWSNLDKQKYAGLSPDVEAKLASAAVAIAAAAAVAKAAAAAANVAANAALQARLMADEAVASGSYAGQGPVISFSDEMKYLGNATPASILKHDNGTSSSSSIIHAARETARKRVEAASAASKRAENMDAIIRAAELAAEAVCQAGKIVAMGDPLPLSVLAATGPEGYWKDPQVSPQRVNKANELVTGNLNVPGTGDVPDDSVRCGAKEGLSSSLQIPIAQTEMPSGKDSKEPKGHKTSETTLEVVLEDGNGPKSPTTSENENVEADGSSKENIIREGTCVEILRDGKGFKAAWFTAKVLNLSDEMAHVSYDVLTSGEGSEKLTEWVPLRREGAEAPKIRSSRPVIALPYEGTRKRRRAAVNDYNWSVGDRVDAWVKDSWWEGVVTEKNKKDDTMFTIYFPVQGETSTVKAWHLRPSLLWKDGEWIEWSNSRQKNASSNTGDTPKQKRPRILEGKDKDTVSENTNTKEPGEHDEQMLPNLGTGETVFNVGKATGDGTRTARIGLQKEGSKVVFGVPKPGKKRKFMEVSKHYVAGRTDRTNEANDPVKSTKYSTPQGSGPRGWRSTPKTDAAEKRTVGPKSRLPRPGNKPGATSGRTIPQKENSSNSAASTPSPGPAFIDNNAKTKSSGAFGGSSNALEKQSSMDQSVSSSDAPIVFSAVARRSDAVPSKKLSTTNARSVRGNKGKFAPPVGRLGRVEEGKVFNSAASSASGQSSGTEPRRSVRRIQPTSRLLEGLQSSLMVSKIPSVSHDKSHKSKPAVRGNNNNS
ncbi:hypothetical protein LINPERHAP2_LOCUS43095 [Linum perenne]